MRHVSILKTVLKLLWVRACKSVTLCLQFKKICKYTYSEYIHILNQGNDHGNKEGSRFEICLESGPNRIHH
jgi:hypothetical protein